MLYNSLHLLQINRQEYITPAQGGEHIDPIGPAQYTQGLPTPFPGSQPGYQGSLLTTCSGRERKKKEERRKERKRKKKKEKKRKRKKKKEKGRQRKTKEDIGRKRQKQEDKERESKKKD